MKTRTIIEQLTQEDLVALLCTATYGSSWLEIYAPDREGVDITEEDCREDVWAKCLLAGKKVECYDHYAEGEVYGSLPHTKDKREDWDGIVTYYLTLQDIEAGLSKCADGQAGSWCATSFRLFQEDTGNIDIEEAEMMMQIILFGEIIYG